MKFEELPSNTKLKFYLKDREHIVSVTTILRDYKEINLNESGQVLNFERYIIRHKSPLVKRTIHAVSTYSTLKWEIYEPKYTTLNIDQAIFSKIINQKILKDEPIKLIKDDIHYNGIKVISVHEFSFMALEHLTKTVAEASIKKVFEGWEVEVIYKYEAPTIIEAILKAIEKNEEYL